MKWDDGYQSPRKLKRSSKSVKIRQNIRDIIVTKEIVTQNSDDVIKTKKIETQNSDDVTETKEKDQHCQQDDDPALAEFEKGAEPTTHPYTPGDPCSEPGVDQGWIESELGEGLEDAHESRLDSGLKAVPELRLGSKMELEFGGCNDNPSVETRKSSEFDIGMEFF